MQQSIDTHAENAAHAHARTNPVLVYAILAACTIIEVGITIGAALPRQTLIPVLLSISFVKASLIALYYMHLRYEKALYGIAFIIPAAFAVMLLTVLLVG